MKRATYILCLATLAWAGRGLAVPRAHQATLRTGDGLAECAGEWYFSGKPGIRVFWTGGDPCPIMQAECDSATVTDQQGTHKVLACSPDSEESRGRKAGYRL